MRRLIQVVILIMPVIFTGLPAYAQIADFFKGAPDMTRTEIIALMGEPQHTREAFSRFNHADTGTALDYTGTIMDGESTLTYHFFKDDRLKFVSYSVTLEELPPPQQKAVFDEIGRRIFSELPCQYLRQKLPASRSMRVYYDRWLNENYFIIMVCNALPMENEEVRLQNIVLDFYPLRNAPDYILKEIEFFKKDCQGYEGQGALFPEL